MPAHIRAYVRACVRASALVAYICIHNLSCHASIWGLASVIVKEHGGHFDTIVTAHRARTQTRKLRIWCFFDTVCTSLLGGGGGVKEENICNMLGAQ